MSSLQKKPSFSETCSRLSRYLKEKGSFGDLSLGMTCNPDINGNQPNKPSLSRSVFISLLLKLKTGLHVDRKLKNRFYFGYYFLFCLCKFFFFSKLIFQIFVSF